jgi:hypothetical protein
MRGTDEHVERVREFGWSKPTQIGQQGGTT